MIRVTLLLILLAAPALAADDVPDAKTLYEKGEALVDKADFDGAAKALKAASRAEPANKLYAGRAMMLVRVLRARKYVATADVDEKWEKVAISLHAFYVREGLPAEAVTLDRKIYEERPGMTSAALLAESLLESGKNEEAAKHLAALPAKQKDLQNRVYEGIALARLTKTEAAKKVHSGLALPADVRTGILYDVARLEALIGESEKAVATLTRFFENLPEAKQKLLRNTAKDCPDFATLAKTPAFARAIAVASKVEESGCSGGSGCGSCPDRGGCDSEKKDG